jgi:hypothetical protein
MSDPVSAEDIERIVGVPRHYKAHYGRAVSAEQTVYILHSKLCLAIIRDLRECRFSVALDRGIEERRWAGHEDVAVVLDIWNGELVPWLPPRPDLERLERVGQAIILIIETFFDAMGVDVALEDIESLSDRIVKDILTLEGFLGFI